MNTPPDTKELPKQESPARDRAFRERRREWVWAKAEATAPFPLQPDEAHPDVPPAQVALDAWAIDQKIEQTRADLRAEEEAALIKQIEVLMEQLKNLPSRQKLAELATQREKAYAELQKARDAAVYAVNARYSDVARVTRVGTEAQ